MESSLKFRLAKKLFFKVLENMRDCSLEIACGGQTHHFGDANHPLRATIAVHDDRFFQRAVLNGDIGVGESYMEGEWSTPDLVSVVRVGVRNISGIMNGNAAVSFIHRLADWVAHRVKPNTVSGSRKNIAYHYDLGNEFYRLFLDESLTYSSAYFATPQDSLEQAQLNKLDLICRKLQLGPADHVLEIGTGWGAFAAHAATNYGCKVTTTTISREQHAYASTVFQPLREIGCQIELLFEDYRHLRGKFDKIVSIEMFEAVGYRFYDDFFSSCDRLLTPDGMMLLQTITLKEQEFPAYLRRSDWIRKHIFPGSELASVAEITRSLARATQLQTFHLEDIGWHYAQTLSEWRRRFQTALPDARGLGFDDRFLRMWDYYLAYCEGSFRERYVGDVQMLVAKTGINRPLLNDPMPALAGETERMGIRS